MPVNEAKEPALKVSQLTVNYDKTPVLWDISCEVPSGNLVGIIGPNGAGKSTFLKTAMGLVSPLSGYVTFLGKPLKEVRKKVAYVPQRESVDWDFPITVLDLVLMGRYGRLGWIRRPKTEDIEAAMRVLETVGLAALAHRQISQLSGGQQQRVFLARALLQDAEIYLMDEPFAGIDAATEAVLVYLLQQLKKEGKTVMVVHHDLNTLESYFTWIIMLNLRLIACGPTTEVLTTEMLARTYGKGPVLLDEVVRLQRGKKTGMS
jgi:manganese/zinc/iron transport system ATP- binding protein